MWKNSVSVKVTLPVSAPIKPYEHKQTDQANQRVLRVTGRPAAMRLDLGAITGAFVGSVVNE